jgi:hypothetical protein
VETAEVALEKAIRPHISGTFPEGQTGSLNNAGLGLFFTTEMAKLTAGRFLLATRGAALFLSSNEDANTHKLKFLPPPGTAFPGTLAVFELPLEVVDRDALLDVIRERATERTPAAATRTWLSYEEPPADATLFRISDWSRRQDGPEAFAEQLRQILTSGRSVALDFAGVGIATQSVLHALLFHGIRVAWALGTRIYILRAAAAVRSGLDYLESYALKKLPQAASGRRSCP